jgi:hypothetical protein
MKIQCIVIGLAAALAGCVTPHQQTRAGSATQAVEAPTAPLEGRRIVYDGSAGLFILPDGSTAAANPSGGFMLPNGGLATPDGAGGLILPNGTRCSSDGTRGYICP